MNLFIAASNRKKNCMIIAKDLSDQNDKIIYLSDMKINYCLGCNRCVEKINSYCVQQDDMQKIYSLLLSAENIIFISPVYMNHLTSICKSLIDRLNPFCCHELLKDKKIGLITVGQMSEEENNDINNSLIEYFNSLSEFFFFNFDFYGYFSSGDIIEIDNVKKDSQIYNKKIIEIKRKIQKHTK